MTDRESSFVLRRILVALDASMHSLAALAAAVDLAALMQAEVEGLFVEDVNLLRLADLPFACEVRQTAQLEALNGAAMARALKAQAAQARQALEMAAGRAQVRWSFRVVRGQVAQEVLGAAAQADLVTLGKQGRSRSLGVRLGSTAVRLASGAPGSLLLVEHGVSAGQPVLVVYDGSEGNQRALDAAAHLAKAAGTFLVVLLLAEAPDGARELERQAAERIERWGVRSQFRSLSRADFHVLWRVVQHEGNGLVVLSAQSTLLPPEAVPQLLDRVRNPVLLVR